MSKYHVPDKWDQLDCPFDPNHVVDAKRYQRHLLKCRRNFPHVKKLHCPFNHRHVVDVDKYQHHLANCPDRVRIDDDLIRDADITKKRMKGNLALPPPPEFAPVCSEDWDDDEDNSIPPDFINIRHAQSGPKSVVHQFPQQSRIAQEPRHVQREARMPREMPQILLMMGATNDPNQAMALAGIGRGMPSAASLAGGSSRGPGSVASMRTTPIGRGIPNGGPPSLNLGRGSGNTPSIVSTNQTSGGAGGLAGRHQMNGVGPRAAQMQAMPGVARGRGRGRGIHNGLNGSVGTPSPPSSETSDSQMRESEKERERGSDRGSDQGSDRGSERGLGRGLGRGSDRGSDQGSERGLGRGSKRGSEQGLARGSEKGSERGSDRELHGSDEESERGFVRESERSAASDAAFRAIFDPNVQISFVTPNVNAQATSSEHNGREAEEEGEEEEEEEVEEEDDEETKRRKAEEEEEAKRRAKKHKRNLEKKMREINRLELKKENGEKLSREEKTKIALKREILEQLEVLELGDSDSDE